MELDFKKMKNKRICVAVSGGVDSMVLLHLLKQNQALGKYTLCAVNFEHGIRGEESKEDSRFVANICKEWEIPLYFFEENCIERATREKQSLETSARAFRMEHYEQLITEEKADIIATAHHANDEAETVLFRICRGSSLTGASGIQENEKFLRPLLKVTKERIVEYAQRENIPFREDATNFEREATRNVLRLDVLPLLESRISGATANLARFAEIARDDDSLLYELSKELIVKSESEILVRYSEKTPLFRRACLSVMKELNIEKDYTFSHLQALFDLQTLKMGACITLPKGIEAKRVEKGIVFYEKKDKTEIKIYEEIPFTLGSFLIGDYEVTVGEIAPSEYDGKLLWIDKEKLLEVCVIRTRREGDVFRKFGGGTKTLKRYLIDKKIPKEDREIPLIAEKNGNRVYAIFGVEISEDVKTEGNSNPVYLTVKKYRR